MYKQKKKRPAEKRGPAMSKAALTEVWRRPRASRSKIEAATCAAPQEKQAQEVQAYEHDSTSCVLIIVAP